MKRTLSIILFVFTGVIAFSQSFSGPESVEFDAANNRYLVSCRGSGGSIQAVVPGQSPTLFTSNVTDPLGLEVLGNKLWVCDNGRVKSFDLTTGALVNNINIGGTFLNGITNDGGENLFVTDFGANEIYRINANTESFNVMVANTVSTPNGIWYDGFNNRLIYVNWGTNSAIKAVSLADSSVSTIMSTTMANCDGIAYDGVGTYYISTWGSQNVFSFDNLFGNRTSVVTGLSNPADIYYNTANDTLAVPNAGNNTVTFHYMGSSAGISELNEHENSVVYPNPVAANGKLHYNLNEASTVELKIYAMNGVSVVKELKKFYEKGELTIDLSEDNLSTGEYVYSLQTSSGIFKGKLVIQ